MKKKKEKGFWQTFIAILLGEQAEAILDSVKTKVDRTIEETEAKVAIATRKVVQTLAIVFIIFLGFVFVLVGISQYLEKIPSLEGGLGYVLVGAVLVIFALIGRLLTGYRLVKQ